MAWLAGAMDGHLDGPAEAAPVQQAHQRGQLNDRPGRVARGYARAEPHDRVPRGHALAVPGASPAHRDLDPDGWLQQVEVGSVEQTNFDQAHGAASIWAPARVESGA